MQFRKLAEQRQRGETRQCQQQGLAGDAARVALFDQLAPAGGETKACASEGRAHAHAHQQQPARDRTCAEHPDRPVKPCRQVLRRVRAVQRERDLRLRGNLAQARTEADVDHLTRLPNRRAFERRLVSAAMEARVAGTPLTIAFCDVDHFKQVNDRHGHAAGDRVLCAMAASFAAMAGEACFTARHGGEEFVLLFEGLGAEAAKARLDAIRRALAARVLMNRDTGQPFGKITFSGGVAEVTDDADTRGALARADAALYRAKQQGRNRIELG